MKKVLIVEDEIAYITLLSKLLTKHGYTVITATNGREGLALALQQKPDLILLDVRMPILNGLDMLEQLRKDPYGKTAKVILLTNLEPDDTMLQKIITTHPAFYFAKSDMQLESLIEKIQSLFT